MQPDVAGTVNKPSHLQGDLVDGDCLDHALHVPHTQSFSSFSLPCTASAANGTEVMDAAADENYPEVAQQSQSECGKNDAQADSNGVGDADNSDHKVITLVQYAICSLLLHVRTLQFSGHYVMYHVCLAVDYLAVILLDSTSISDMWVNHSVGCALLPPMC